MADIEFYRLSMTGAEADSGIRAGMQAGTANGVLLGDGNGGVRAAEAGRDFGFPLLTGNGPPTSNTASNIGQHYFDMSATQPPYEYICVGINSNGFVWVVFGDTGNGFKISGYFASLETLRAAIAGGTVSAPTEGVAYGIGTAAPYDIYVWDAVNSTWVNNGPLGASGGGSGVPPHGTAGQALIKLSDADDDVGWGPVSDIAPGSIGSAQIIPGATYTMTSATLTVAAWANNQQTVAVLGVTDSNAVIVSPAPVDYIAYADSGIYCAAQGAGTLTFVCASKPQAAVTVNVIIPK